QLKSAEMIRFIQTCGIHPISAFKAVMRMVGVDCGPARPPLPAVMAEEQMSLRSGLERLGFFAYACR
ncbi:MAG: N-acetylneuraminate lyase, partial [Planctomycetota bacterium]|nr:N-acetylneuraminate lyase [Planctomycetota bacterium]